MVWVSVEDGLPNPPFNRVIIATDRGVGSASFNILNGFTSVLLNDNTQHQMVEVTHWMYFPEMPK